MQQNLAVTVRRVGDRLVFEMDGCRVPAVMGGNEGASCGCGGTCDSCSAPAAPADVPAELSPLLTAVWEARTAGWLSVHADGGHYSVAVDHLADHDSLLRLVAAETGDDATAADAIRFALAMTPPADPPTTDPPAGDPAPVEPGVLERAITAATAGREEFEGFVPTSWGHLPAREYARRQELRQQALDAIVDWAEAERVALRAAAGEAMADVEDRWHAYLMVEGIRTTDNRAVAMGALSWRDLPLPLEWARAYEGGHYGKVVVGSIESVDRVEGPMGMYLWYGEGTWDLGGEDGAECARQVQLQGGTRFVSADLEVLRSHIESATGAEIDFLDMLFGDGDEEWFDVLDEARGMGATVVSTPAFPQCVIAPMSVELQQVEPMVKEPTLVPDLVASGAPAIVVREPAPASYFESPGFTRDDPRMVEVKDKSGRVFRGCPWTIADDGRIFGHLALWGFCHTGFTNECVLAPRSRSQYAYFRTGEYRSAEGQRIPVGQLTIGTSHAAGYMSHSSAARHYDETGLGYCDVAVGEDEFGIWAAGLLRTKVKDGTSGFRTLDADDLRVIRATAPSGDWRLIGGSMELVAALNVNVPGFPVPRVGLAASAQIPERAITEVFYEYDHGERRMVSLIAAGRMPRNPLGGAVSELRSAVQRIDGTFSRFLPILEQLEADRNAATVADLEARIGLT